MTGSNAYVLADALHINRQRFRRVELDDPTEAPPMHICLLLPRLHVVHEQRKLCLKRLEGPLDQFARKHDNGNGPSDGEIIRSLTGVGPIVLGRLLAEAAVLLRGRDGATFRCYAGPARITRRSGKS